MCKVKGCQKLVVKNGLCIGHEKQRLQGKTPQPFVNQAKCSFDGCVNKAHSKGLCVAHYTQQRLGKPLKPLQKQFHGLSEKDRFRKWTKKGKNGCIEWQGSSNQEGWHGQWRNEAGRIELTHRAAWRMFKGEIPEGKHVLHHCDNPKCVNVDHLYLGDHKDNMGDMWRRNRANPKAHLGEAHGMAKLTEDQVKEIRKIPKSESAIQVARQYGVSQTTILDIRNRKLWRHI